MKKAVVSTAAALLITGLAWIGATRAATEASTTETTALPVRPDVLEEVGPAIERLAESLVPADAEPLGPEAEKGLAYLANQQLASGGWGQGGGWRQAGHGRIEPTDQAYRDSLKTLFPEK